MLNKTLLPLSLNESHKRLTEMAGYILHFGTKTIILCHIVPDDDRGRRKKAEASLEEAAGLFRDQGFQTEWVIREGGIANQVNGLVQELNVDYLSIKWKHKNVIRRAMFGSPDADILRICSFPTFIYKNRPLVEDKSRLKKVLYATDFQESDKTVLPYLKNLTPGAETLYLLHVRGRAPDPNTNRERLQQVHKKLGILSRQCGNTFGNIEPLVTIGSIRSVIARKAWKYDADLIFIGRNDKQKPLDKILGSTAESLPHKAYCPVFIIV